MYLILVWVFVIDAYIRQCCSARVYFYGFYFSVGEMIKRVGLIYVVGDVAESALVGFDLCHGDENKIKTNSL